jgi:hypothetical protein
MRGVARSRGDGGGLTYLGKLPEAEGEFADQFCAGAGFRGSPGRCEYSLSRFLGPTLRAD